VASITTMTIKLEEREMASAIVAAYLRDRAEQYVPSSGICYALHDVAAKVAAGEAFAAYDAGELDDLMPTHRRTTAPVEYDHKRRPR
jgi:hypothetical protein